MNYKEIYEILKKHELERFYEDNKMIPRYNYPKLINELLEAINYIQCCETLEPLPPLNFMDFDKYVKSLGIKKINSNYFVRGDEIFGIKELYLKHLEYLDTL